MKKCKFCGKPAPNNMQGYCQACYHYFVVKKLPLHTPYNDGTIHYADNGDAICPICGKQYRKLGGHLVQQHGILAAKAYANVGVNPRKARASNVAYRVHMNRVQDPKTISVNLVEKGTNTRFNGVNGNKKRFEKKCDTNVRKEK